MLPRRTALDTFTTAVVLALAAALLVAWARATAHVVHLPEVPSLLYGSLLAALGLTLMGLSALATPAPASEPDTPRSLWGADGIYRYVPYPVHAGFLLACIGAAIATNSVSGLWLVCPVVAVGTAVLALAQRRAAAPFVPRTARLGIPPDNSARPTLWHRLAPFPMLFIPWLVFYEAVVYFGPPQGAFETFLPGEVHWPIFQWSELFYVSPYVLVTLAPFIATKNSVLRRFFIAALLGMGLVDLIFLTLPAIAPFRPFEPHGFLGQMMLADRAADRNNGTAAFPSFHVVWSYLGAAVWADRQPRLRVLWYAWATAVALSCVFTGMHALLDIIAGFLVFLLTYNYRSVWNKFLALAQYLADAWRALPVAPVRSNELSVYATPLFVVMVAIIGLLTGVQHHHRELFIVLVAALGGGALWARLTQFFVPADHRFDYFGALVGAAAGALIITRLGQDPWPALASAAVAAPLMQAAGRAACLVRGCCQGPLCAARLGVRYSPVPGSLTMVMNPHVPVHPVALYALLANLVLADIVLRLWWIDTPATFVVGYYLILANLARLGFDALQERPATPTFLHLPAGTWKALAAILAGAVLTTL